MNTISDNHLEIAVVVHFNYTIVCVDICPLASVSKIDNVFPHFTWVFRKRH